MSNGTNVSPADEVMTTIGLIDQLTPILHGLRGLLHVMSLDSALCAHHSAALVLLSEDAARASELLARFDPSRK